MKAAWNNFIERLGSLLFRPDRDALQRYAVGVMGALLAMLGNWLLWPVCHETPFAIPFTFGLLVLIYGGLGPALVLIGSSFITTDFFLIAPLNPLSKSLAFRLLIVLTHMLTANVMRRQWLKAERQRKVTEAALNARDQFMSIAAHELLTPITAMKLQAQLILRRAEEYEPRVVARLKVFEHQIDRLVDLSTHLLDVTRIVGNQMRFDSQEVDLSRITTEVLGRNEHLIERCGSDIRMELQPALLGVWDPLRLEQVLINLISNACKYGDAKPILVRTWGDGVNAYLAVQDHGIGICEEDQRKIFERFGRAVSEKHYSGMGLGLWIVTRIVAAMKGAIAVKSELGEGSTFTVKLPRYADADAIVAEAPPVEVQRRAG